MVTKKSLHRVIPKYKIQIGISHRANSRAILTIKYICGTSDDEYELTYFSKESEDSVTSTIIAFKEL